MNSLVKEKKKKKSNPYDAAVEKSGIIYHELNNNERKGKEDKGDAYLKMQGELVD